jgi:hypothetical protein
VNQINITASDRIFLDTIFENLHSGTPFPDTLTADIFEPTKVSVYTLLKPLMEEYKASDQFADACVNFQVFIRVDVFED